MLENSGPWTYPSCFLRVAPATLLSASFAMTLTKRTFYPVDEVVAGWTGLEPIIAWAKAKAEDVKALGVAMGEDELPFEAIRSIARRNAVRCFCGFGSLPHPDKSPR